MNSWRAADDRLFDADKFLFTRNLPTEADCNAGQKQIKTPHEKVTNLKQNLAKHPNYQKQYEEMEKIEDEKKEAMKQSMKQFVIRGTGFISSRQEGHPIHRLHQPTVAVVEARPFRTLLSAEYQANFKGREHYTEWAMPRIYNAFKKEIMLRLKDCPALSFTSDIWSGPTKFHKSHSPWHRFNVQAPEIRSMCLSFPREPQL
uniref:Transposase n=1 Tax=Ditylenchus dipsaci TaxID=166011 RepID=A0A915EQM5_9BILA